VTLSQVCSVPDGLRAVYALKVKDASTGGFRLLISDRVVDAVGLLELEPRDVRGKPRDKLEPLGRRTKLVGIIMEGMLEPQPAPLATGWFERLYGEDFLDAKFLGYTRSDSTISDIMNAVSKDQASHAEYPSGCETREMRETRRYWSKAVRLAFGEQA